VDSIVSRASGKLGSS